MALAMERQASGLPTRFSVGTVYVVEGRGGEYGRLRVAARYVVTPRGERIDVPPSGRLQLAHTHGRRRVANHGFSQKHMPNRLKGAQKEISRLGKKYAVAAERTRQVHVSR